jgi:(p)ppGpp synthase/HD superfamily hydrolase
MNDIFCWESKYESCTYSESLLNKIYLQNEKSNYQVDILEIKKAIYYAKKYHGSQKRLSGEPYYFHPLAVTELVAPHCFKTDILVTSILHDTIEDTDLTKDLIEYIFDANIASKVDDLTRVKSADLKVTSAEIIKILWTKKKEDLLIVKLCDRLHNMQDLGIKSQFKIFKTSKETLISFLTLNIFLVDKFPKMSIIEQKLINLIYQYLTIPKQDYLLAEEIDYVDSFQLVSPNFQNDINPNNIKH